MTRDEMIVNNLGLVYQVTNKYQIEDAYNEGVLGLIKAADTYKPERGYAFSTYAATCIRNHMFLYIRNFYRNKRKVLQEAISIETEIGDKIKLADVLGNKDDTDYIAAKIDIVNAIDRLDSKDKEFLRNMLTKTLKEMAEIYGVSRQRIDQKIKLVREKIKKEMGD